MRTELAPILRDCATRYRWQGRDIRPLEDAFLRADALDDRIRGPLADFLGPDHPVSDGQWQALLALQARLPNGVLEPLRGPSATRALATAETVLRCWLPARLVAATRAPNSLFTGTVVVRCADPTRFPIVAVPQDIIASGRTQEWRTADEFVTDYLGQVQVMRALARRYGFLNPARLDDGVHQLSRCLAYREPCPDRSTLGPCRGQRLAADWREEFGTGGRRRLLDRLRRLLRAEYAEEHRTRGLLEVLASLLPSEERLREAFVGLEAGLAGDGVENLVDGVECLFRVRAFRVAREMAARRLETPDAPPRRGRFQEFLSEGDGGAAARRGHVVPTRATQVPSNPRPPSVAQVAAVLRTPRTTVERMSKLTEEDAVRRAKTRHERRRRGPRAS